MELDTENFSVHTLMLQSSLEVENTMREILIHLTPATFVHITAYMHNTVLVQNLKAQLLKYMKDEDIVFLKSQDKTGVRVVLYCLKNKDNQDFRSDQLLDHLQQEVFEKQKQLQQCKRELLKRYFTDNLTHMPNIYQLRKDLQENDLAGLVVLNIDNFKTINNFYGFNVGDFVIEKVASHLNRFLAEYKVYRLSVDEFAFVLQENLSFYELKEFLAELYESLKNLTINYQQSKIFVDMTLASCSNTNTQDIFSKVSMALRYAKENSLPFWIYEDRMRFENEYEKNLQISSVVRNAVENFRILPYFQSIIDNRSSKIKKYECLARLVDENGTVVSPALFIPIAKKIKVYNLVTKIIIDKSFEVFEKNDFEFTINLSIEDLMSSEIFEYIIAKLQSSNASYRVIFELLESEAIADFKKVERFINEVKRYGAKIAIDDFGSGYSNFFYLTKMSVDYIKIDGDLIAHIDTDKNSSLVVETIVDFARKLGIQTIAEYVHSSPILTKVKELGIDYSQGFYIDEPHLKLT